MDAALPTDPFAIDGKFAAPDEHAQLLVIGAGTAGLAAAIHAAELGKHVVLIDENPVVAALMGLDVPLFYGQRMTASVQEPARMIERIVASNPAIEAAFDAGVDVRLGQTAWGVFVNGAALRALPAKVAGLSDGVKSWMCGFDALILATGARDLVLGFDGIDLPGVMGARAFHSLLTRYDAFDGKRLIILGSGPLAVETAEAALSRGLAVTALLETLPEPQCAPSAVEFLSARGVAIRTGVTHLRAEAGAMGVAAVTCTSTGAESLECDTVCLAIDAVPAIELAASLGCELIFDGELGGHVPVTRAGGATSVPGVFAAGDCAGLSQPAECNRQGREAAQAAAAWLDGHELTRFHPVRARDSDSTDYRLAWMRMLSEGGDSVPICLCEEVTRSELLGVSPPRYLACTSNKMAARNSQTLHDDGPLNPDQIKRLTRAGMGVCQGRRCREQIAFQLALATGAPLAEIPLASYRAPVRPLPLGVLAEDTKELPWDVWFGIRSQWIPYAMIGTPEEAAMLASGPQQTGESPPGVSAMKVPS